MKKVPHNIISAGVSVTAFLLLFFSCSTEPPVQKQRVFEGYGMWMDTTLKTPDKIIRGLEPGMKVEEVKKIETLTPVEEDSSSIYYEVKADSVTDVSFTYMIADKTLDEIDMMIRTKNLEAGTAVFNDLKKYFESKFSTPIMEKGIYVFTGKTSGGDPARISLEDRSGVDYGQINVLVYREK